MQHTRIGFAALGVFVSIAAAGNVSVGDDLIKTLPETWFSFGPNIGVVNFTGDPIDPGTLGDTDTIIRRQRATDFPNQGDTPWDGQPKPNTDDTIDIEMVALSLVSVDPVYLAGHDSFFDVFVSLDNVTPSVGTMTIGHEWNDAGLYQGTFDSTLTVFADALFVPVGGGPGSFTVDIDNLELNSSGTLWAHRPWGIGFTVVEEHPGVGVHTGESIPTPAVLAVLVVGGPVLISRRRR